MINADDNQTRARADINLQCEAILRLAQVVESQQAMLEILDDRVRRLERKPRWWRKRV